MSAFAMPLRWLQHGVDIWVVLTPTEVRWSVRGIALALGDDKTAAGISDRHDVAMPSWTVTTATPYIQGLIGQAAHAAQLLQWLEDQTFILESIGNEQLERLASSPAHPTDDRGHALPTVYSVQEAAEILDRDPAIVTGRDRLFDQMLRSGWLIRQGDTFRTATEAVREGLVAVQPRRVPGREGLYPQVLLTVDGIRVMHRLLGGQAAIHFASPAYTPLEETPA